MLIYTLSLVLSNDVSASVTTYASKRSKYFMFFLIHHEVLTALAHVVILAVTSLVKTRLYLSTHISLIRIVQFHPTNLQTEDQAYFVNNWNEFFPF